MVPVRSYAAWDFAGPPGVIDGGVLGAFDGTGTPVRDAPEEVRQRLGAIDGGAVFDMPLSEVGLGSRAEGAQIWYQLAGWYAHQDPGGRSVLQPRLPAPLRPSSPVGDAALLDLLVDAANQGDAGRPLPSAGCPAVGRLRPRLRQGWRSASPVAFWTVRSRTREPSPTARQRWGVPPG